MKNLRKLNRKRAEPPLDVERKKDSGVTRLPQRDVSDLTGYKKKALYSLVILIFFFAIIVTRLWFLQVHQGDYYSRLADSNRVRTLEIAAPRGNLYDQIGRAHV